MPESAIDLPESCLRGVPSSDRVLDNGVVASHNFYFVGADRSDKRHEMSINWEDDDGALRFTLRQEREGKRQFRMGGVRIERKELDRLNHKPVADGCLSYERAEEPDNLYHGNLLIEGSVPKPRMKQIAAHIANEASRIITLEETEGNRNP